MSVMRHREKTEDDPITVSKITSRSWNGTCANPGGTNVYSYPVYDIQRRRYAKVMNDVVTPHYASIISKGGIVNSPMDSVETEEISEPFSFSAILSVKKWDTGCNPDKYVFSGAEHNGVRDSLDFLNLLDLGYIDVPDVDVERMTSLAVTQAWAKVEDCKVDTLVSLAELSMTVESLTDIIKRTIRLIRFLKVRHWFMISQELSAKQLADRYMELRYSLRPLIYDFRSFYEQFNSAVLKEGERQTFRGWESYQNTVQNQKTYTYTGVSVAGTDIQTFTAVRSSVRDVTVRSGILTEVKSSTWLDRWGFDNIFEALWERVPFSFVVDWVFNVGKTIAALTPEVGFKTLASWYTVKDSQYQFSSIVDTSRTFVPKAGYSTINIDISADGCKAAKTVISRYRVPNPSLDIFPTFKLKLDLLKLTDLLVMLSQITRR